MQVIEKGTMPDGTGIQREDWSSDFPSLHVLNDVVAAYPIAKNYVTRNAFQGASGLTYVWEYPQKYRTFRLALQFPCQEEAETAYDKLINGDANLLDYKEHFQEKKYAFCL